MYNYLNFNKINNNLEKDIENGVRAELRPEVRYSPSANRLVSAYIEHIKKSIKEADRSGANTFFIMDFPIGKGTYLCSSYVKTKGQWMLLKDPGVQACTL